MKMDALEAAEKRFDDRLPELQNDIVKIDRRIRLFTIMAWIFISLGIMIFIGGFSLYFISFKNPEQFYNLDALGDFLSGTVASLWSLAGLFLIYVAFLGQKQQILNQQIELLYSQLELLHTRQELEGQKFEMKEQNVTLKRQRFENTFFQLIRNLLDIINAMDVENESGETVNGRDSFEEIYNSLYLKIYRKPGGEVNIELPTATEKYEAIYKQYQSDLGHYYRSLLNIFDFINSSSDIEDKALYSNIIRELLSSYELILLFYHYISNPRLKEYAEQYALFKNLDGDLLFDIRHKNEYPASAFSEKT